MDVDDDMREAIEKSARHLYGLVHARYVVTTRGLAKMVSLQLADSFLFIEKIANGLIRWTNTNKAYLANVLE
jgi:hypothetical protein